MKKRTKKYRLGGKLKKYNTKSHKNGGKLVDANGNPVKGSNPPAAEIEKKESILANNGGQYVFSDSLGTNKRAAEILKNYPKDDALSLNARRSAFAKLKRLNEMKKQQTERTRAVGMGLSSSRSKSADKLYEKNLGGNLPKYKNGGGIIGKVKDLIHHSDSIGRLEQESSRLWFLDQYDRRQKWLKKGSKDYFNDQIKDYQHPAPSIIGSADDVRKRIEDGSKEYFDKQIKDYQPKYQNKKNLGGDLLSAGLGALPDFINELKPKDDLYNSFSNSVGNLIPKMFLGSKIEPINTETYDSKFALFNNDPSKHHLELIGKSRRDNANPVPELLGSLDIAPVKQGLIGANARMRPDRSDMPMSVSNKLPSTATPQMPTAPTLKDTNVRGSTFFERLKENYQGSNLKKGLEEQDKSNILRGIGTVGSAFNAYRKPDVETPRFTNFSEGDNLVKDAMIDPQAAINESNLAFNTGNFLAKDSSRTSGQYFNRLRANAARSGQRASQIELEADRANVGTKLNLANRADRKASSIAGEQKRIDIANSQNLAKSRDLQQQFLNTMYDTGTALDKKRYLEEATNNMNEAQKRQFVLNLAMLSKNSTNFKIDSKAMENFIKNYDFFDTNTIINELVKYTDNGE